MLVTDYNLVRRYNCARNENYNLTKSNSKAIYLRCTKC